ncbi:hypothetical protein GCM10010508_43240 [Streptomyces naganishii JCM 4654]|uniref:Uncharacterized protein n=1 Tax=Streptomyces naganishii JCM 4654 TaxID=1306179 RepID=A0A918Y642_9ACTN|nr:hypothetical protein GCM10010508_43240 [Streptomyces naganishii JCM 4654]
MTVQYEGDMQRKRRDHASPDSAGAVGVVRARRHVTGPSSPSAGTAGTPQRSQAARASGSSSPSRTDHRFPGGTAEPQHTEYEQ